MCSGLMLPSGGPHIGMWPIVDGLLKGIFGEYKRSPGVRDSGWPPALPRCLAKDKLKENHQDENSEAYQRFISVCYSEFQRFPRESAPRRSVETQSCPFIAHWGTVTGHSPKQEDGGLQLQKSLVDLVALVLMQRRERIFWSRGAYSWKWVLGVTEFHEDWSPRVTEESAKWSLGHQRPVLTLFSWGLFPLCVNVTSS